MRFDPLILDDWGLEPFIPVEARHLLEVVDERSPLRSTLITSQLPLENWHAAVPDPTLADAILDRLVHTSYKIFMKGESMRTVIPRLASNETED